MLFALFMVVALLGGLVGFAAGAAYVMTLEGSLADKPEYSRLPLDQRVRESEGRQ